MSTLDDLDDLDRRIIAALQVDGRRTFSSLANELGIPASSVRYRTKRLEDSKLLQIVGIANPLAIGFDRYAMVGIHTKAGQARKVGRALAQLPETTYVVLTAGRYEILAEIICRDLTHFVDVIDNGIGALEGVLSAEPFMVTEVHKLAYGWGVPGVPMATT